MANKVRLIDAKPLMQSGWHLVRTGESNKFLESMSLADVPTVDAVEVDRCKGCYYYESRNTGHGYCKYFDTLRIDNDFCSSWERKHNG